MPNIDVSWVLDRPAFQDESLVWLRPNAETVDADGFVAKAVEEVPFSGVVTALQGVNLLRVPESERREGSILVTTRAALREGDELRWQARLYTVTSVNDYSRYGAGFVELTASLKQIN